MIDTAPLVPFVAVAAVLVIVPGPNTLLIVSSGLTGGRAAGLAAVAGVETGTLVHSIAAGLGISALLATSPAAFDAVKYGGAAYLLGLGLRALSGRARRAQPPASGAELLRTYRTALLASALNPKAAVFFLALLPQFIDRDRGHVLAQFLILGGTVSLLGMAFGTMLTVAISADVVRRSLRSDRVERWRQPVIGMVLLALAAGVLLSDG